MKKSIISLTLLFAFVLPILSSCVYGDIVAEPSVPYKEPQSVVYGAEKWFDYAMKPEEMKEAFKQEIFFNLPELSSEISYFERRFYSNGNEILNIDTGDSTYNDLPLSVYFADVTHDGIRDMCISLWQTEQSLPTMSIFFVSIYNVLVFDLAENKSYRFTDYDDYVLREIKPHTEFKEWDGTLYMVDVTTGDDFIYTVSVKDGNLYKTLAEEQNALANVIVDGDFIVEECAYFTSGSYGVQTVEKYYHPTEAELAEFTESLENGERLDMAFLDIFSLDYDGYIKINGVSIYFMSNGKSFAAKNYLITSEDATEILNKWKEKSLPYIQ